MSTKIMNYHQIMDLPEPNHMWARGNKDSYINPPMEGYNIDHSIDINPHAPRARNNDNLHKDAYDDLIQPNPTDNASDSAQPDKLSNTNTIPGPIRGTADANFPRQPPQNDDIDLNNSCMQLPLPGDLACHAHGIYSSERLMNTDGCKMNLLCDEIERHRYPNIPEHEVLNIHDSTNYDQDTETQNSENRFHFTKMESLPSQQEYAQVVAHDELASMQAYPPNGPSSSIFNQNLTTEQQPTLFQYDLHSQLEEHEYGIELNNSRIQLPSEIDCYAYDIYSSERLTNAGGREIDPLCDVPEQHRYPNLPGPEVLNTHDSTNYDQDAEMRSALQQEDTQVHSALALGSLAQTQTSNATDQIIRLLASFVQMQALKPMQVCPPNDLTPSISNQNSTTERQPASPKYGRSLPPGGPRLIKVITDEEIDGLRKLKAKEDRRKRTENPDSEHRKKVRKAGSKAHHERNSSEINELKSMKQRLEESIKISESSRVKRVNLYNEMLEKVVSKMVWIINTLNNLRYNIPSQFDSTLEECTNRSIDKMNYFINSNTRLFVHNYLLSDERDINSQIDLESEEDLINDLKDIEEGLKQLKMEKKEITEQAYKLEVDKLYARKHRKNKALERIRLRNENKQLKSKDDKIGRDLIEIESRCKSFSIDVGDVFRDGVDCICRWIEQYQLINCPLPQDVISNFILAKSMNFFN